MTPPPSTPKKTRRVQPKIIGHTSPTPRISGTTARTSLRSLGGTLTAASSNHRPNATPGVRTPVGAPGMHGFPRARVTARDNNSGLAVSVARALRDQAEAESATAATATTAPEAVLIDATKPGKARRTRKVDPKAPARPSVRGRPTTPDEAPLRHAPAAERLTDRTASAGSLADAPQRTANLVRPQVDGQTATQANTQTSHRPVRRLTDVWARDPSRPRPSRLLAELNAALADEAAAAE